MSGFVAVRSSGLGEAFGGQAWRVWDVFVALDRFAKRLVMTVDFLGSVTAPDQMGSR